MGHNSKICKAFCKKGCRFYLWASPMATDRNIIQIKSSCLQHECNKDHKNMHVSAHWIANKYLDQFRADPSWKAARVIQVVKNNQSVNISNTAWRAKAIVSRYNSCTFFLINLHVSHVSQFQCQPISASMFSYFFFFMWYCSLE